MALKNKCVRYLIAIFGISVLSILVPNPFLSAQGQNFIPPYEQRDLTDRPPMGRRQRPGQFQRGRMQGGSQPHLQRDHPKWWANEQRAQKRQRRIRRGREMARRLMNDPNAPASIRERAQRLDNVLTRMEDLERELQNERKAFLQKHQAEREELRNLKERMEIIRQGLIAAREQAKADNLHKLQEIERSTKEARTLAQELRRHYRRQRGQQSDRSGEE